MMQRMLLAAVGAMIAMTSPALAGTVRVAAAANLTGVAEEIVALFERQTGHDTVLSFGATGQLYAQITQGAPFEVFLAADDATPALAVSEGFGVEGTVITYAVGHLVLFSTILDVSGGAAALGGDFDKLAIADPQRAPYGAAAVETLRALGFYEALAPRLVIGGSVSQALQFIETGNAELGFVAASQVIGRDAVWLVPGELHEPIRQDAVLLTAGADNPAAAAFMTFLRSEAAAARLEAAGYSVE